MRTVRVTAVLATTHLVPKYEGVRLSPKVLREMVERVTSGSLPMVWNHDPRRQLAPSNVVANIEERDGGELAAVIEFDIDEGVWAELERERTAAGAPGGFSWSGATPYVSLGSPSAPRVSVAGESGEFDPEDVAEAARALDQHARVAVGELFQFGAAQDIARFVVDIGPDAVKVLAPELLGAALYDFIRRALRRKKRPGPTMVDIRVEETAGRRRIQAMVVTDDPDLAATAIKDLMTGLAHYKGIVDFDADAQAWRPRMDGPGLRGSAWWTEPRKSRRLGGGRHRLGQRHHGRVNAVAKRPARRRRSRCT